VDQVGRPAGTNAGQVAVCFAEVENAMNARTRWLVSAILISVVCPAWAIVCPPGVGLHTVGPHGRFRTMNEALRAIGGCIASQNIIFLERGVHRESLSLEFSAGDLTIAGGWSPTTNSSAPYDTQWRAPPDGGRVLSVRLSGLARFTLRDIALMDGWDLREGAGIYADLDNQSQMSLINTWLSYNEVATVTADQWVSTGRGGGMSAHLRQSARLGLDTVLAQYNAIANAASAHGVGIAITSYSPYTQASLNRVTAFANGGYAPGAPGVKANECRGAGVDLVIDDASPPRTFLHEGRYLDADTHEPMYLADHRLVVRSSTFESNYCFGWQWPDGVGLSATVNGTGTEITDPKNQLEGYFGANILFEANTLAGNYEWGGNDQDAQLLMLTTRHKDRLLARNNLFDGRGGSNAAARLYHSGLAPEGIPLVVQSTIKFIGNTVVRHLRRPLLMTGVATTLHDSIAYPLYVVRNNLITHAAEIGPQTIDDVLSNTAFFRPAPGSVPAVELHPNCVLANPLFVDPANGDYRLLNTSPVVDAGAVLSTEEMGVFDRWGRTRVRGPAPDCGAHEL